MSSLYDKMNLPVYFSLGFQGFQLAEFDIKLSIRRYSCFYGHFVVFGVNIRFRILLAVHLGSVNSTLLVINRARVTS